MHVGILCIWQIRAQKPAVGRNSDGLITILFLNQGVFYGRNRYTSKF